jgi:nucleotide-binding universal stress UspA family protein
MLQKILLADSGSGQGEQMLNYLLDLPSFQSATVTVLHVLPPEAGSDQMNDKRQEAAVTLAKTVERLHLESGTNRVRAVNTLLREGEPKDEVCRVADEIGADLIIMGSRGLKRLQAILDNSVSQYVFQLSSHPMLLVKEDVFVKRLNRVMVAVNPSGASQEALDIAIRMVRDIKDGRLILAHVNKDLNARVKLTPAEAERDAVLAPIVSRLKRESITYQCFAGNGKPGSEICAIAEEASADLLILGSPDRRPSVARSFVDLDRLLGASVSDYVRVHTPCPVLFVRQSEK